jgi:hypothetical protein
MQKLRYLIMGLLALTSGTLGCDRSQETAPTPQADRLTAEPETNPQPEESPAPTPPEELPREPGGIMNCYIHGTRYGTVPQGSSPLAGQQVVFVLTEDNSLSVTIGEASVRSRTRDEGTAVFITDESSTPENLACGANVEGHYRFRMSGSCVLTLEAVSDLCEGRRALLGGIVLSPNE